MFKRGREVTVDISEKKKEALHQNEQSIDQLVVSAICFSCIDIFQIIIFIRRLSNLLANFQVYQN